MKVIALIENKFDDKVILDDLFTSNPIVPTDVKYISFRLDILDNEYQEKAQIVYDAVVNQLVNEGVPVDTVDLRLVVDLYLRPDDQEDIRAVESKTGLLFIKSFVETYAEHFESVHSFLMSKIVSDGSAFDYNKERLIEIEGGVTLLKKPVTVVLDKPELADDKFGALDYTDVLEENKNSRFRHISFINAVIYGERV